MTIKNSHEHANKHRKMPQCVYNQYNECRMNAHYFSPRASMKE